MANVTDPLARSVHGTNPQNLIEYITRQKIYDSRYWKEECFGLNAADIVTKAVKLRTVGGSYGGNRKPCHFLCLTLKMLQIQPDDDIVEELVNNEDFKYVRALGAFYLRLTGRPQDIYELLEPLYQNYRKIRCRTYMEWDVYPMDEFIDLLLTQTTVCGISLPRLPKREHLEDAGYLEERKSALVGDAEEALEKLMELAGKGSDAARVALEAREEKKKRREEKEKKVATVASDGGGGSRAPPASDSGDGRYQRPRHTEEKDGGDRYRKDDGRRWHHGGGGSGGTKGRERSRSRSRSWGRRPPSPRGGGGHNVDRDGPFHSDRRRNGGGDDRDRGRRTPSSRDGGGGGRHDEEDDQFRRGGMRDERRRHDDDDHRETGGGRRRGHNSDGEDREWGRRKRSRDRRESDEEEGEEKEEGEEGGEQESSNRSAKGRHGDDGHSGYGDDDRKKKKKKDKKKKKEKDREPSYGTLFKKSSKSTAKSADVGDDGRFSSSGGRSKSGTTERKESGRGGRGDTDDNPVSGRGGGGDSTGRGGPPPEEGSDEYWNEQRAKLGLKPLRK